MAQKKEFKTVNLKKLAEKAKIPYQKVYNNIILEKYDTLTINERTILANHLFEELTPLFQEFGFMVQLKRIPK